MNYWQTYYYYYGEVSQVLAPANTIWYTDCNNYVVYPSYYLALATADPTYGQNGTARYQDRHNGGANVAFMDGHSKWLSRSEIEGDSGLYHLSQYWWGRAPRT
jgi:prepilin-type processing-associated H-X9-DG protein